MTRTHRPWALRALAFTLAARHGRSSNPSTSAGYQLVLDYFWYEHDMGLQLDTGHVEEHFEDNLEDVKTWRIPLRFQIIFQAIITHLTPRKIRATVGSPPRPG